MQFNAEQYFSNEAFLRGRLVKYGGFTTQDDTLYDYLHKIDINVIHKITHTFLCTKIIWNIIIHF